MDSCDFSYFRIWLYQTMTSSFGSRKTEEANALELFKVRTLSWFRSEYQFYLFRLDTDTVVENDVKVAEVESWWRSYEQSDFITEKVQADVESSCFWGMFQRSLPTDHLNRPLPVSTISRMSTNVTFFVRICHERVLQIKKNKLQWEKVCDSIVEPKYRSRTRSTWIFDWNSCFKEGCVLDKIS